ncbi:MAG: DUF1579 domain-containing protein [Elusimicrobia bacterium]|nr:DUF1579 domain-containing protein [Elusimicrobiota bacterium]
MPRLILASLLLLAAGLARAGTSPRRAAAMSKLGFMRGVWAGEAKGVERDGKPYTVWQTERMGPLLGGDVVVVEGRGYKEDGSTAFNAFGVISWDERADKYEFRSYAQGYAGTFDFKPTSDGYVWEIPAGEAVLRYTATVKDGRWREIGERVVQGKTVQFFEMNLKRVGDTDWPLGTPVPPTAGR